MNNCYLNYIIKTKSEPYKFFNGLFFVKEFEHAYLYNNIEYPTSRIKESNCPNELEIGVVKIELL